MNYHERAAEKLLEEDELSAQEVTALAVAAYNSRENGSEEIYQEAIEHANQVLEENKKLAGKTYEDVEIPLSDMRGILNEYGENLEGAVKEAYAGLDSGDRELIEEFQLDYLHHVSDNVVHEGEQVFTI
jgi:hypothetical protein